MASSEDSSRKKAPTDEDFEANSESGAAPHPHVSEPEASGAERAAGRWSGKAVLDDATQVVGQPKLTSDDPAGFGETTRAARFEIPPEGDLAGDQTRVGTLADWSGSVAVSEETLPSSANPLLNIEGLPSPAPDPFGLPAGLPESGEVSSVGVDIPAHLQLPNMDFSLPKLPNLGNVTAPNALYPASSELPPHLQLPTFPDLGLGLPPLSAAPLGEPGVPGSSEATHPGTSPELAGLALAQSQAESAGGPPGVPPARPRKTGEVPSPPPRRTGGAEMAQSATLGMPDDLSLPNLAPPPSKRNLTLISTSVPNEPNDGQRRVLWPFVVIASLAAVTVVGVLQKDRLLALLVPHKKIHQPVPPSSPQDQAKGAFATGVHAYAAKDYAKAIESFERALTLDASLADAHRSLGIVYATTHEQAKAVEHYRRYLDLAPKAADALQVQKIVDDYAKAQAKPVAPPAAEDTAPGPALKKGKRFRGKHR